MLTHNQTTPYKLMKINLKFHQHFYSETVKRSCLLSSLRSHGKAGCQIIWWQSQEMMIHTTVCTLDPWWLQVLDLSIRTNILLSGPVILQIKL